MNMVPADRSAYKNVDVKIVDRVAWVTMNRPSKRNAISPQLSADMLGVLRELRSDPDVRVVVLTGAGTSFCAGMDLNMFGELAERPAEFAIASENARAWMWEGITRFPKPIIAMVNGYCFGGGFVPLIASDIAIAGSDAVFGLSEINWGHFLGGAVSKLAVDAMGRRATNYFALTGETINAAKAVDLDLVTMTVPQQQLRTTVSAIAQTIAGKSEAALRSIKEALRVAPSMTVDQCYEYAAAKSDQLKMRDKNNIRDRSRQKFLAGSGYRPGLDTTDIA